MESNLNLRNSHPLSTHRWSYLAVSLTGKFPGRSAQKLPHWRRWSVCEAVAWQGPREQELLCSIRQACRDFAGSHTKCGGTCPLLKEWWRLYQLLPFYGFPRGWSIRDSINILCLRRLRATASLFQETALTTSHTAGKRGGCCCWNPTFAEERMQYIRGRCKRDCKREHDSVA